MNQISDRRGAIRVLAGITIATIALELPVHAVPQPASMRVAQGAIACIVSKTTPVFVTSDPTDSTVLPNRPLSVGTPVALAQPLPNNPPARIQIKPNGFVDYAALDCGKPTTTPPPGKTTACRKVKNNVRSATVHRVPSNAGILIAAVGAGQPVYVTQTGGATTSRKDANGGVWVEVDLQRTFGRNFGIPAPSLGWLSNTQPVPGGTLGMC